MKLGIPLSIKLAKLLVLSIILTCFILPSNYLRARALPLSLSQEPVAVRARRESPMHPILTYTMWLGSCLCNVSSCLLDSTHTVNSADSSLASVL